MEGLTVEAEGLVVVMGDAHAYFRKGLHQERPFIVEWEPVLGHYW